VEQLVSNQPLVAWIIFVAAAILEVGGDAIIRKGLREQAPGNDFAVMLMLLGGLMLASYGFVVNIVKWDFSKLLGVYVAVFAVVSVLIGKFAFAENVSLSTWIGVGIIVLGGMVIQFGPW
jgi:drug/metabolite transporter superfamily protein YnfA